MITNNSYTANDDAINFNISEEINNLKLGELEKLIVHYRSELNKLLKNNMYGLPIEKNQTKEFYNRLFCLVNILKQLRENWNNKINELTDSEKLNYLK